MKNSHTITLLIIFVVVFSLTTIALTLEVSQRVFAAKKNKSEDKSSLDAATPTSASSQTSNSGDGSSNDMLNSLSLPQCPDGSLPVKGKCPLPPLIIPPPDDSTKSKVTIPSTSESSNTDSASSNTLTASLPATHNTSTGNSKESNNRHDSTTATGSTSDSSTVAPVSLPCPDGSLPVKGKCPLSPPPTSEDTSSTRNKHKSADKSTSDVFTPTIGERNTNADSIPSSKTKEDTTGSNDGSTTIRSPSTISDGSGNSKDTEGKDSSTTTTPPPAPPPTTSDSSNSDSSSNSNKDSIADSSSKTPIPAIIPSNEGLGGTDTGGAGGGSSTGAGSGSSSSNSGENTKPSSTASGNGIWNSGSSISSSSSGTSGSSTTNSKKTSETSVSQAAIAATNQIINSPGSTILNQQSIKQSVKINNEINNIIRKNVISESSSSSTTAASTTPREISNLITVKLATTTSTMSRNAYLPIGDVAPYHLIGGHVTANLPNNRLNIVVAQLSSSNGAIQHAVVLDMIKSQISNIFETDLGYQISGTNPLTGKQDVVSDITNLFLWNNGNQQVTFVEPNAVTMNLIYR